MKMKRFKALVMVMVMVTALTGSVPTVEAKTKTSITVANKATGKKIGKKVTLKTGEKIQLKVKYGKKTVTKKAKYKTSNKSIATINKKGKITAKSAGTCTVKVTYKKKAKKIKVVVKAVEKKTNENNSSAADNHEPIMPDSRDTKAVPAEELLTLRKQNTTDPHPECAHEWKLYFHSDDLWFQPNMPVNPDPMDKVTLYRLRCPKCGTVGYTDNTMVARTALTYTNNELSALIMYYQPEGVYCQKKHKHDYHWVWCYNPTRGSWSYMYECKLCGCQ